MKSIKLLLGHLFPQALYRNSQNNHGRLDAIDGLRALAVLSVIAYHFNIGFAPTGFVGVDIFFVISGYVITLSLTKNQSSSIIQYILAFYKRRILRIMPALVVCLIIVGAVSQLFVPNSWLSSRNDTTGLYSFFGISNFALLEGLDGYFNDRAEFNPFLHTWSLAVEEQFYLFFPLLLLPWLRQVIENDSSSRIRRHLVLAIGLFSLVYAAFETPREPQFAFYLLPSRFWELATGAVLFQYHSEKRLTPLSAFSIKLTTIFGCSLIVSSLFLTNINAFPFPWAILPAVGTLALISAAKSPASNESLIIKIFTNPFVTYLGRASYSLYLWHWPVVALMRWTIGFETGTHLALALVLTLILGLSSYHLVERTFLKSHQLHHIPAWGIVPAGITLTIGAAVLFNIIINSRYQLSVVNMQAGWDAWDMPSINHSLRHHPAKTTNTLWVIGDSHAGAYIGMVSEAAARAGMKLQIKGLPGCSVANLRNANSDANICRENLNRLLTDPSQHYAKGDVVFLASLRGQRLSDQWGMYKHDLLEWILNGDKSDEYRKAFEEASEIIGSLRSLGVKVIIDAPKPVFRAPIFRCSDWFNRMNPVCSPGFEVPKSELMKIDAPVLDSLHNLKTKYPDLIIWDPFPILCPNSICSVFRDKKPLYFDQDHLSGYGNQALVESFSELLLSLNHN